MDESTYPFLNKRKIILITGMILAVLLPLVLSIMIRSLDINYLNKVFYSDLAKWGVVLFLAFYAYKIENQPLLIWKADDYGVGFILVSVGVLYVAYVIISVISAIPYWFGYQETDTLMRKTMLLFKGHPASIFFISITAGVTEELIFRSYLLTRLSMFFKEPHIPVILSSILFSAMHYSYHSLGEFIFTFLLGIVCSIYYFKYRNIHALILAHALIDFIVFNSAHHFY